MRGPSLFACLPGLTTNCLLQTLLKNSNALGIAAEQPLLPPPPPSEEVFPSEVNAIASHFVSCLCPQFMPLLFTQSLISVDL
jgi:hypothetical protein